MNSKAIKRQLLAAVAMVLVAAIALGSSTYAWFVASGTVTAQGMKVQAKSEGGLAIRWAGEVSELWGTTASAKMETSKQLLPASTADLTKWTYAKAVNAASSDADVKTYTDITSSVFSGSNGAFNDANDYVAMQPFEIRSTDKNRVAKGLYVSGVEISRAEEKDLDPAIRVGVRLITTSGSNVYFIYAPISGASTDYTWKNAASNNATTKVTLSQVGTSSDNNSKLVNVSDSIPYDKGNPVKVQVYIWYEGEDETLFSDNYAANDLSVTVSFSSYDFQENT